MEHAQILVVEDEMIIAEDIRYSLHELGYAVSAIASSGEEAIQKAAEIRPDLVLMDIVLRGRMDGIETTKHLREHYNVPIIYLTAYEDDSTLERAKVTEPYGYILKPFEERELRSTIEMALYKHQMEQRLQEHEQWLAITLNSIGDGVIATDQEGKVIFMNVVAEILTGWTQQEARGRLLVDVFHIVQGETHESIAGPIARVLQEDVVTYLANDTVLVRKDGVEIPIDDTIASIKDTQGRIIGGVLVFRDISERKKAEELLRQTQKRESLGVLAGGVAHDFNNLLVAMLGQTSLALAKTDPQNPSYVHIEKAVKAATRAADLTRQLLAYSGRGQFELSHLDLNTAVQENLHLLQAAVRKNVVLKAHLADTLPLIEADIGQIQQVIMNLILNAAEALDNEPGTVTVKTDTKQLESNDTLYWYYTGTPLAPGRYVLLQVHDTGKGMDADTLLKIFDPFYTTKQTGRGLGLAAVLGIVRGHKGGLRVESKEGEGTIFTLLFPISEGKIAATSTSKTLQKSDRAPGLVLVIDDEEPVLEAVTDILELEGIPVLTAESGEQGIALYQEHASDISLVLLDLSMPGLNGEETFSQLRRINPEVRTILSSGYNEAEANRRFSGSGVAGFLQKPYDTHTLIEAVWQNFE